jgi:hypothetical protein
MSVRHDVPDIHVAAAAITPPALSAKSWGG